MPYRLSKAFDQTQRMRAVDVLTRGVREGKTSTDIIGDLRAEGLTYRRTNMLRDVRRAKASAWALTPENRDRALTWFDEVFEPFIVEKGLDPRTAWKEWNKVKDEAWELLEDLEMGLEWWDRYQSVFA